MYIWNAEMTKVIVRCLLLDWNHWMSVHAMNFYFYLWLVKILLPENTSSHISLHLEFIIEQGHRVNWVSGSLDSRITGSLGHKMWPSSIYDSYIVTSRQRDIFLNQPSSISMGISRVIDNRRRSLSEFARTATKQHQGNRPISQYYLLIYFRLF